MSTEKPHVLSPTTLNFILISLWRFKNHMLLTWFVGSRFTPTPLGNVLNHYGPLFSPYMGIFLCDARRFPRLVAPHKFALLTSWIQKQVFSWFYLHFIQYVWNIKQWAFVFSLSLLLNYIIHLPQNSCTIACRWSNIDNQIDKCNWTLINVTGLWQV